MPKGQPRDWAQVEQDALAKAKKARAEMDKRMIPLGYTLDRARTLPAKEKEALLDILLKVNEDRGDQDRLRKLLGQ